MTRVDAAPSGDARPPSPYAERPSPTLENALDRFLADQQHVIREHVTAVPAALPALPLVERGGKGLRSRILWLSAQAVACPLADDAASDDRRRQHLLRASAAIELAHLGSLIHDDIIDGAATRRGVASVHRQAGTLAAVRAGSALLRVASRLIAPFPRSIRRRVARAVLATCRGQIRELTSTNTLVTAGERFAIMQDKTAAFFGLAARVGATLAGGLPQEVRALRRFAQRFGVAFQIADDILDLAGDPVCLGRGNGADLRCGVYTLPVILAAERTPAVETALARLRRVGAVDELASCTHRILRSGGVERAARESVRWLSRGESALASVRSSDALHALRRLADAVLERSIPEERSLRFDRDAAAVICELDFDALEGAAALASPRPAADAAPLHDAIWSRLAAIEPRLAPAVVGLVRSGDPHAGYDATPRHDVVDGLGADGETETRADADLAFHAARIANDLSERAMRPGALTMLLCAIDCLHAVSLDLLAETAARVHADVENAILAGASRSKDTEWSCEAATVFSATPLDGLTPAAHDFVRPA